MGAEYKRLSQIIGNVASLGPVLLYDDIEDTLKWAKSGTGADYTVEKSTTYPYVRTYGLHLKTKTTTPAENDYVKAQRSFPPRPELKLHLEFFLLPVNKTNCKLLKMLIEYDDLTYLHSIQLSYTNSNDTWTYMDSEGGETTIIANACEPMDDSWHRVVIEADLSTYKLIKFQFDSVTYDLSTASYYIEDSGAESFATIYFWLTSTGDGEAEYYFDSILLSEVF